jgi:hypothetical protein
LVLPLEVRCCGPSHEEGAAKVGVDGSIPDLGGKRIKVGKRHGIIPGGVVDQDIEATEWTVSSTAALQEAGSV